MKALKMKPGMNLMDVLKWNWFYLFLLYHWSCQYLFFWLHWTKRVSLSFEEKKIQHPLYVECGCFQLVTLCTLHNLCYNIKISRIVIDGEVITVSGSIPQIVVDKHVIHTEGKNAKAFQTESTRARTVINVQIESIQSWEAIVCRFYWCHK